MTATSAHARTTDAALRARAAAVIPGGMYGHQSAAGLPPLVGIILMRASIPALRRVE